MCVCVCVCVCLCVCMCVCVCVPSGTRDVVEFTTETGPIEFAKGEHTKGVLDHNNGVILPEIEDRLSFEAVHCRAGALHVRLRLSFRVQMYLRALSNSIGV